MGPGVLFGILLCYTPGLCDKLVMTWQTNTLWRKYVPVNWVINGHDNQP